MRRAENDCEKVVWKGRIALLRQKIFRCSAPVKMPGQPLRPPIYSTPRRSRHSSDTTNTTEPSPSMTNTISPQLAWVTPGP